MKNKSLKGRICIFWLVFVVSAACMTNVICEPDQNDSENLFNTVVEPSKMIDVKINKLFNDGSIRLVRSKISEDDFNEYAEKIQANDNDEDRFNVLKEYGVVTASMDFDSFFQIMKNKLNNYKKISTSASDTITCSFTWFNMKMDTFCFNAWIPFIIWAGYADSGSIKCRCDELSCLPPDSISFDVFLLLPIGINNISPGLDLDGGSFIGFCLYLEATCYLM